MIMLLNVNQLTSGAAATIDVIQPEADSAEVKGLFTMLMEQVGTSAEEVITSDVPLGDVLPEEESGQVAVDVNVDVTLIVPSGAESSKPVVDGQPSVTEGNIHTVDNSVRIDPKSPNAPASNALTTTMIEKAVLEKEHSYILPQKGNTSDTAEIKVVVPVEVKSKLDLKADIKSAAEEILAAIKNTPTNTNDNKGDAVSTVQNPRFTPVSETTSKPILQSNLDAREIGRKLMALLNEHIQVNQGLNTKTATIRLDPPDLGRLEVTIRVDQDKLQIQLAATSGHARDALQAGTDRLRGELAGQFVSVDVDVSSQDEQRSQQDEYNEGITEQPQDDAEVTSVADKEVLAIA